MATRKPHLVKQAPEIDKPTESDTNIPVRPKALVFVSHDSRDADIAEAFANLLSDVSAGTLKSFRSSDKKGNSGIEFGAEWYTSIMSQLEDATDVVALLTARSIDRPWILYEAGVAKGKLETTVLGLALGVPLDKVSTGPFGQFQNCGDDEDSLTRLVMQLLQRNPDASPREKAVRMQVKLFICKESGSDSNSFTPWPRYAMRAADQAPVKWACIVQELRLGGVGSGSGAAGAASGLAFSAGVSGYKAGLLASGLS